MEVINSPRVFAAPSFFKLQQLKANINIRNGGAVSRQAASGAGMMKMDVDVAGGPTPFQLELRLE
jgi:hypothetical protein